MNYGEIISEAFWLTWRNRFLWFFGFFVGGGFSGFNLFNNVRNADRQGIVSLGDEVRRFVSENVVLVVALLVTLALVGIVLSLVSQGALIDGIAALHRGEERRFSSALRAGLSNFWGVLGFTILLLLISFVIGVFLVVFFLLMGLPVARIFATTDSLGVRIAIIAFVILLYIGLFIVIFIPLSIIWQFGLRDLVIGRTGIFGSLRNGYDLFLGRLGRSFLVWIIGFALSLGLGIAGLVALGILAIILLGPAVVLFVTDYQIVAVVAGVIGGLLFLVPLFVLWGALGTFNHAYWTLAYLRFVALTEETVQPPDQGA